MKKRIMPVIMAAMMVFVFIPNTVFGMENNGGVTDDGRTYGGHIPVADPQVTFTDEGFSAQGTESEDPGEYYNSMEQPWYQNNIKNQKDAEMCWLFSTSTVAELSYCKEMYEKNGSTPDPRLSPLHMGYFFFHHQPDPLGKTAGDSNNVVLRDSKGRLKKWYQIGGNEILALTAMSGWTGFANIGTGPKGDNYKADSAYDLNTAYDNELVLKDSNTFFFNPEKSSDISTVKSMIKDNGAVITGYNFKEECEAKVENESGGTDYCHYWPGEPDSNHAVAAVGWDDSYSRENFKTDRFNMVMDAATEKESCGELKIGRTNYIDLPADIDAACYKITSATDQAVKFTADQTDTWGALYKINKSGNNVLRLMERNPYGDEFSFSYKLKAGETYYFVTGFNGDYYGEYNLKVSKVSTAQTPDKYVYMAPQKDGAWIIQNSWGEKFRNYYISYEDKSFSYFGKDKTKLYFCVSAMKMQEPSKYKYNYFYDGTASDYAIPLDKNTKIANLFYVGKKDISLEAISFFQQTEGYAPFNIKIYSNVTSSTSPMGGHKVADFDYASEYAGNKTCELPKPVFLPAGTRYSIVITTKAAKESVSFETTSKVDGYLAKTAAGQSMVYDGGWYDLNEENVCWRIKGMANDASEDVRYIGDADISGFASRVWTGSEFTPLPSVKLDGQKLEKDKDYKVYYSNNKNVGLARVSVKGIGDYAGFVDKTFKINPKKATIGSITAGTGKMTVKAAKTAGVYGGSKFQIAYKKYGTSTWHYTTSSYQSKTIKNLTKGKKYYVKIRARKTVNGTTYSGSWSSAKLSYKIK